MGIEHCTRNGHRSTHSRRLLRALATIIVISLTAALCGLFILLGVLAVATSTDSPTDVMPRYPWRTNRPAAPVEPAPPAPSPAPAPLPIPARSATPTPAPAATPPNPVRQDLVLFQRSLIGTGAFALALATTGIAIVGWRRRQW